MITGEQQRPNTQSGDGACPVKRAVRPGETRELGKLLNSLPPAPASHISRLQ